MINSKKPKKETHSSSDGSFDDIRCLFSFIEAHPSNQAWHYLHSSTLKADDMVLLHREPTQLSDMRIIVSDIFGQRCGYLAPEHEHLIAPELDMNIIWRAYVIAPMCRVHGRTLVFLWTPNYEE